MSLSLIMDHEVLKSFIPEEKLKHFLCFESIYLVNDGKNIQAPYRAPFSEKLSIDKTEYDLRLTQKVRDEKLDSIL